MTEDAQLLALADQTLWVTALISGPVLIATLVVGLVVGIIQAATSVNEQTLSFIRAGVRGAGRGDDGAAG